MFLWKRFTISFLLFLALVNLRPQWKIVDAFMSLSVNPFETSTMTPFDDQSVIEMESVDMTSLDSSKNSEAFGGEHAGNSKFPHQTSKTSKIRKAANATKIIKRPFPASAEAIDSSLLVSPMPSDPKLYFIHVGKAGGLTLNLILDIEGKWKALACFMQRSEHYENHLQRHMNLSVLATSPPCYVPQPRYSSQLSQHLVSHLHLFGSRFSKLQREWILDHTNTFLFLLRDPIDRIVSAYNFHRHNFANTARRDRQLFYHVCFPNGMEDLLHQVRYPQQHDSNVTANCQSIGIRALQGGRRGSCGGNHFQYNYGYYASKTIDLRPHHSVTVIRTEYMWEDIIALDKALGGTGDFSNAGTKVSHGSETWKGTQKYNAYLGLENLELLCCFLHAELAVYQRLILLAANLNHEQKRQTLSSTLTHCQIDYEGDPVLQPFSWWSYYNTTCLPMMPNVP